MATVELDAEFLALPLEAIRSAVLERARALGCEHAEARIERIRSQVVSLRDGWLETSADNVELGLGLRVVHDGSFGFAATIEIDVDAAAALADEAVATARATAPAVAERVELADEPSHGESVWSAAYDLDPSGVPMAEKVALLEDWSGRLLRSAGVDHVTASLLAVVEDKHYANLSGTVTTQRRVRVHPEVEATAVDAEAGGFETMRSVAPPAGTGLGVPARPGLRLGRRARGYPITSPKSSMPPLSRRVPTTSSSIPRTSG